MKTTVELIKNGDRFLVKNNLGMSLWQYNIIENEEFPKAVIASVITSLLQVTVQRVLEIESENITFTLEFQ